MKPVLTPGPIARKGILPVELPLVPDEEDDAVVQRGPVDDPRQLRLEPVVAGLDRVAARAAGRAVHVVAEVRGDVDVIRHVVRRQVRGERAVGLAVRDAIGVGLRRRVARDVLEEDEGIVLGRVEAAARDRAGAGGGILPFLIGDPGDVVGRILDLRHQVRGAARAVGRRGVAVRGEGTIGEGVRSRLHVDVVRLARQAESQGIVEIRGVGVGRNQGVVDVRRVGRVAIDLRRIVVFHRDHEDVLDHRRAGRR